MFAQKELIILSLNIDCKKSEPKSEDFAIFDVLKLIISFFVVCIHTGIGATTTEMNLYFLQGLFRVAVPIFFFLAGYFLFRKIPKEKVMSKESSEAIKRYFYRILLIYVIWSLFYLVIAQIPEWIKNGFSLRDLFVYIEYATIRGDSYLHLWYLSSLFTGVALVFLSRKWFSLRDSLIISIVFFVIGLLLQPYYFLIKPVIEGFPVTNWLMYNIFNRFIGGPRCGLFFGFVYVALGAYFAEHKKVLPRYISLIGLIVSFALSIAEIILIDKKWSWDGGTYGALQLSHIPLVISLFCFLFSFKNVKIGHSKELRSISTLVYLIHPAIILMTKLIPGYTQISKHLFVSGIIVYFLSIVISIVWITAEKNKAFRFLKKVR